MKRAYIDYLRDILDATDKAERFLSDVSEDQFKANDEKVFADARQSTEPQQVKGFFNA